MLAAAGDVVAETAGRDDISRRIYESWSAFRAKAMALAPLTELGYMSMRAL